VSSYTSSERKRSLLVLKENYNGMTIDKSTRSQTPRTRLRKKNLEMDAKFMQERPLGPALDSSIPETMI